MDTNDAEIRAAGDRMKPEGPCLSGEDLDAYFSDRVGEERAGAVRAHLASCASCVDLARDFQLFREGASPRAARTARATLYRNPFVQLAAAASVVIGVWFFSRTPTVVPPPDTSDLRGARQAGAIELVSPKGDLTAPPASFEWRAVEHASSYEVELRGVDLEVIWQAADVRGTSRALPKEVSARLRSGEDYGWRVTATLRDGRRVVSAIETFRLR